ncbi:MAG: type II toxin-antitoxin system VapC family toxin [Candidatus Woesearchaeota archaeon]
MDNELIYLDTNCYMAYFLNREYGEDSFSLILKALSCEYKVVTSNVVINEIKFNGLAEEFKEFIRLLKRRNKLENVFSTANDRKKAQQLKEKYGVPFNDCLHAVLCKKSEAASLVTMDMKHFMRLRSVVTPVYPQEL